MTDEYRCELCGELMPPGETMFKFHGYSGPCPKEPLPRPAPINWQERAERAEAEVATCKVCRAINLAADDMPDEIRRLRERIATLEKDAERWRAVHELDGDQMDAFVAAHWINPEALNATIDAAIDADRAALKEGKP